MTVSIRYREKEKGIALIITLAILVIATILVVGFTSAMRTERQASAAMANNETASLIAQSAVDHAISILDQNIPQPIPPASSTANPINWIISPGLLTTVRGPNTTAQIPLSSGPPAPLPAQNAELNLPQLSGSGFTILPTSASMRVAWVPVLKDPATTPSASNQITGRYAFWIDDEGARINVNTAYGKPTGMDFTRLTPGVITVGSATYPLGHPSSVNLDVLDLPSNTIDSTSMAAAVGIQGGFSSIDQIKAYVSSGDPSALLNANKFNLTAYSRAPEFNVFGKSRLYFLRRATGQLGFPLFQFFRDSEGPNYFPMEENGNGADRHSLYYTAAAISDYLNRNDWPGMPARSFVDKWGGGPVGQREGDQVAWNLVSIGSFASGDLTGPTASSHYYELANTVQQQGEIGFVSINKPNTDVVVGKLSSKAMLPAYPLPLVNEVSLVISPESYTLGDGTQKYRLHISLNIELWLPPGYPAFDFAQSQMTVGMTYLSYHVTQASPGSANSQQEDAKYVDRSPAPNDNGIRKLWMSNTSGTMNPGQYLQLTTLLPCYVRNTTGFSDGTTGAEDFTTTGTISADFKMRLFALTLSAGTKRTYQLIPVWDTHDPGTTAAPTTWDPPPPANPPAALSPPSDDAKDYIEFQFDLDPSSFSSGEVITRSLEVADPRLGGLARSWQQAPHFSEPQTENADTMNAVNAATTAAGYDTQKLAFVDLSQTGLSSNHPSIGFLSFIPTGMQRALPGSALTFQRSASPSELPDWLLLDLVAPNVTAVNYPTMSYMNSTAGLINVNGQIDPAITAFSRWQPLQGLLENLPGISGSGNASTIVTNLLNHTMSGTDFGATGVYDYPGEICEVAGVADNGATDWDKETIIRNIASSITTKSNALSVWGVAQTVKKKTTNTSYGTFEQGDIVTGEKRFEAIIERYVWKGDDSIGGQGHVSGGGGSYDQLSSSAAQPGHPPPYTGGTWGKLDGPDAPTYPVSASSDPWVQNSPNYTASTIDAANNPVRAVMKYRVVYFRLLNE